MMTIGKSHHFLRTRMNAQISPKMASLLMGQSVAETEGNPEKYSVYSIEY